MKSIKYVLVIALSLIALCVQHIIHEYAHVLAALLFGERVSRIQWLTYHGGTRVFYENEPDLDSPNIDRKWALISGAGFISTIVLGYLFLFSYFLVENTWVKTGLCFFAIIFLIVDSLYFAIGSIFDFGDILGVRKTLNMSKQLSVFLSVTVFLVHCAVVHFSFYR